MALGIKRNRASESLPDSLQAPFVNCNPNEDGEQTIDHLGQSLLRIAPSRMSLPARRIGSLGSLLGKRGPSPTPSQNSGMNKAPFSPTGVRHQGFLILRARNSSTKIPDMKPAESISEASNATIEMSKKRGSALRRNPVTPVMIPRK